jgi:hypothetical protein
MNTRIGFSTQTNNIGSRVIRWFTKSRVSHAFLVYKDQEWGEDFVMEATDGGVKISALAKFSKHNDIIAIIEPKQSLEVGVKEAAINWLGNHFDYEGILGMMIVYIGHWFRLTWRNPFVSTTSAFCSEFVARVLQWSNYPGSEKLIPEDTAPEDLLEFLEKG